MTINARRVASIPMRTPSETWNAICDLLVPGDSVALPELELMVGLASMLIADEYSRDDPIIVSGAGPQLRIYTLHGNDALEDEVTEDSFAFDPTEGEWEVSFPCGEGDLEEAREIAKAFARVAVRPLGTSLTAVEATSSRSQPVVDLVEMGRE